MQHKAAASEIANCMLEGGETAKQFIQRKINANWWDALERHGYTIEQTTGFKGKPHFIARKHLFGDFDEMGIRRWNGYVRVSLAPGFEGTLIWILKINFRPELKWYTPTNVARSTARQLDLCATELGAQQLWNRVKKEFSAERTYNG